MTTYEELFKKQMELKLRNIEASIPNFKCKDEQMCIVIVLLEKHLHPSFQWISSKVLFLKEVSLPLHNLGAL